MKKILLLTIAVISANVVFSQFIYKIKADSVLITNDSCVAELNLENSTKNIKGFLYNRGNGRTEFRKGVIKLNDSTYLIGADTLHTGGGSAGFSAMDGLIKSGSNLYLGNTGSGSGSHNFTANRYQYLNNYFYSIGGNTRNPDSFPVFRFYNNGDFSAGTTNQYHPHSSFKNGIRYNGRLGYLQVGVSDNIDTTVSNMAGPYQTSAIILNSDDPSTISGQLRNSFIGAYNVHLSAGQAINYSMLTGGSYFLGSTSSLAHVVAGGVFHTINGGMNGSLLMGNSQQLQKYDQNSGWFGFFNSNANGSTYGAITGGWANNIGASGQLTVGTYLTNKSHASAAFGNGNVVFTSLPYNSYDSLFTLNTQNIEGRYLLFSLGNSSSKTAVTKSNALSVLYNGRTQINTTGFSNALTETDVTPKAALEVVSTNSGVLLPKLTNTQRNSIISGDLQNGLLLYNTDSSLFQYYNGSNWLSLQNNPGGSSSTTASNGLTKTGNDIALGGSLTSNTTVNGTGSFSLTVTGSVANASSTGSLIVSNSGTGQALYASAGASTAIKGESSSNGVGVMGVSASGIGVQANSTDGAAFQGTSVNSFGAAFSTSPASTNTTVPIMLLNRLTTSAGANGIGGSIDMNVYTSSQSRLATQLISRWTNATDASRISQFDITGVNNAVTETFANFQTAGIVRVNNLTDTLATKAYARSLGGGGGTGWGLTGNAGTNSGTNFLGTTDNISLRIRTNNTQRAVIDSNGRMGINTAVPAYQLDVNGDARVSTLPFVASRDTVVTYDAITKQLKATLPSVSGTLLAVLVFTSGTSYTPTAGTKAILVTMIGGGGGGGGVTGAANSIGAGGGGGSGSMLTKYITGVGAGPFTYAIGAAGTAGANTGGTGGNGGSTTLTVNSVTYTAPGGSGGVGQTAGTTAAMILGGNGGTVSTNGDLNGTGSSGERGFRISGTVGSSGNGASTIHGGGGNARTTAGAGNAGTGFGAGGGGGLSTAATARTGGAGSAGVIIIYEYR